MNENGKIAGYYVVSTLRRFFSVAVCSCCLIVHRQVLLFRSIYVCTLHICMGVLVIERINEYEKSDVCLIEQGHDLNRTLTGLALHNCCVT